MGKFNKDMKNNKISKNTKISKNNKINKEKTPAKLSTMYRERKFNMCIAVNPDRNRNLKGMEYFKIYNSIDPTKATKVARIKFREANYVIHKNKGGKKNWVLNSKERKHLVKMLNSLSDKGEVWNEIIYHFNNKAGEKILEENLLIPEYRSLRSKKIK